MCISTIDQVLQDVYGVNVYSAPATCVVWAAEFMAQRDGIELAKSELSDANRRREKLGKRPAYVEYGHPLF